MRSFFDNVDRTGLTAVWEPRGSWYDGPDLADRVCVENEPVHCVNPFRNDPLVPGRTGTAYFRLHGFGKPSMHRYDFSDDELLRLQEMIRSLPAEVKDVYVFFNNESCYVNGRTFVAMPGTGPSGR